ncbi:MAG: YcbK family protein [Myxococcales bacterium]|nr:YcbK family protein [Myxococcales bacterium]
MVAGPVLVSGEGFLEGHGVAAAKSSSTKSKARKRSAKNGKRSRRGRKKTRGHAVAKSKLNTTPLERPSGDLWVISENLKEEIRLQLYAEDGNFDDAALAKLDHEFRCRRTKEERSVDPRLYEMLSRIQDHFGGKRIHLVSGFRFQRNEGSRHYHASAMDIRIPGVSTRVLNAYVKSLDRGGMGVGLYPRSNFVHVDFRAPGQPSYRWVDHSRPGGKSRGMRRSRRAKRRNSPST